MTALTDKLMDAVETLAAVRGQAVDAKFDLMLTEQALSQTQALAEMEIVEAAGGEKSLGPNAEARKRKMTLGLAVHEEYQKALAQRDQDHLAFEYAQIKARNTEDLVKALRVIVEAG